MTSCWHAWSLIVFLFAGSVFGNQLAQDEKSRIAEEEVKLEFLNNKLDLLAAELRDLNATQQTLLGELQRLDIQIDVSREMLELRELKLAQNYQEININQEQVVVLEKTIAELADYLTKRAVDLYKLGQLSYVRLLLSVEKPSELVRAYRYISHIAQEDVKKMMQFRNQGLTLKKTKALLLRENKRLLINQKELKETLNALATRRVRRTELLKSVAGRQDVAETLVNEFEQVRKKLGLLVSTLTSGVVPDVATVHLPMHIFEGEIGWPVVGAVVGKFGEQQHPRFKTITIRTGIEIAARPGSTVKAVYDGEVVFSSWFEGFGKLLILRHPGGLHSLYGYLEQFTVMPGSWVQSGDSIGLVGETGSLSGPRLYFEIRVDGEPVNPERWLHPKEKLAGFN